MLNTIGFWLLSFILFITWAVVMLAIIKTIKFFKVIEMFKERNDTELNVAAGYLKKIHEQMALLILELKRTNRLIYSAHKDPNQLDGFDYVNEDILRHQKDSTKHPPSGL